MAAVQRPIDWDKPNLRIVYLVEGMFRTPISGDAQFVRWCGPASRAGSGFLAYATLGQNSFPPGMSKPKELPLAPVAWEARLSGGVYDATLGTLKQHIQALSQVTIRVALGDDDNPTAYHSATELRDMATVGRWRGQTARLILVDADDIGSFEVVVEGTWDRDPTSLGPRFFRMTINTGEIIPPTLGWGAQVPANVDFFQQFSYSASTWIQSPNGSASVPYLLNPNHRGRWMGEIFGGATHSSIQNQSNWREIVPYGMISTGNFAWVSPRLDQFCYDIVLETAGGLVKLSALSADNVIRVFNNEDPRRGPVGTCVYFTQQSGFNWHEDSNRAWAELAGGHPILRPSGYSPIGYSGNPELGNNIAAGNKAIPTNTALNPGRNSNAVAVFGDLIQDPHFLGRPDWLHPDTLPHLMGMATVHNWPVEFRNASIPKDLTGDPVPFRVVIETLMRSLPADLTLRMDPADGRRKYFAVGRQQLGQPAVFSIGLEDLADADTPASVTLSADPDGYYSNDSSFSTKEYYNPPVTGLSEGNELVRTNHMQANLVDILEQSSSKYGIPITSETVLDFWRYEDGDAFDQWANVVESTMSVPQKVLEAVHGWRSMRLDLGRIIEYKIDGVLSWPGQIRGMKFNLDSQQVTIKTYHLPTEPRVIDTTTTVRDKDRAVAHKDNPVIGRGRD